MLSRNISRMNDEGIVQKNLVAYWHYSTAVADGATWNNIAPATRGSFNGTYNGTGISKQSDGINFVNSAYGVHNFISIPNFDILNGKNTFTIQVLASSNNTHAYTEYLFDLSASSSDYIDVGFIGGGVGFAPPPIYGNTQVVFNTFYLFTFVFNSTGRKAYINSSLEIQDSSVKTVPIVTQTRIGAGQSSQYNFFEGKIQAVRVYDRDLTPSEIAQNFAIGKNVGL